MASLINTATLALDSGFRQRVEAAMTTAATSVAAEAIGAQTPTVYQTRHILATEVLNNPSAYLDRFAWVVAANATVSGELGAPVAIASSTAADPAVVTTAAVHGYSTGDVVEISGHLVNTSLEGTWPVTVLTATTFSVPVLGVGVGAATGVCVKMPPDADIQFAVNSNWSNMAGVAATS